MPGYDGRGPDGQGPLTGGGRGYCAVTLPDEANGQAPRGFAGLFGRPIFGAPNAGRPALGLGRRGGRGRRGRGGRGRRW